MMSRTRSKQLAEARKRLDNARDSLDKAAQGFSQLTGSPGAKPKASAFSFGDIVVNGCINRGSSVRRGIFVRELTRTIQLTDGKGRFWETGKDNKQLLNLSRLPIPAGSIVKCLENGELARVDNVYDDVNPVGDTVHCYELTTLPADALTPVKHLHMTEITLNEFYVLWTADAVENPKSSSEAVWFQKEFNI